MCKKKTKHPKSIEYRQRLNCFIAFICGIIILANIVILSLCGQSTWIINLTTVIAQFAMAYVAAYIFYRHTTIAIDKIQYDHRKLFNHDNLTDLNTLVKNLLVKANWDRYNYDKDDIAYYFKETDTRNNVKIVCKQLETEIIQLALQYWRWRDDDLEIMTKVYIICRRIKDIVHYEDENFYKEFAWLINHMDTLSSELDRSASYYV